MPPQAISGLAIQPETPPMKTFALASILTLALAATGCASYKDGDSVEFTAQDQKAAIATALASPSRKPEDVARDGARHAAATMEFWGIRPDMTVVELSPGGGYWTDILAPYLNGGGGSLIVTFRDPDQMNEQQRGGFNSFMARYADTAKFGSVTSGICCVASPKPLTTPGSVDMVIASRTMHGWYLQNLSDNAYAKIHEALVPGGLVVVEQHRAAPGQDGAQTAASGYLPQDWVIAQFEARGFELVRNSEINANPNDTKDHPFGVWTLPPTLQTAPRGQPADPTFDNAKYKAIGESDRMALVFRKKA
jgi:predicted methyltransferase